MKCRYTPRPAILTRFPFSAYAGYSSRLWYALHPLLAIPRTVAHAIIACIPISRYAALPCARPYRLRFSFAAQVALSAYAITLFGRVSYDCRVAFAVVDFRALCRVRRPLHQLSKNIAARSLHPLGVPQSLATHMEINANKSRPRSRNARFYWGFRTFAPIFHTSELANLG